MVSQILCDEEGHPLRLLSSMIEVHHLERLHGSHAVFVREQKKLPNLDGLPGETNEERVMKSVRYYSLKGEENE